MNRTLLVAAGLLIVATVLSTVSLVGQVPPGLKSNGYTNSVELDRGESYLIHHADDLAIEIWVEVPEPVQEQIMLTQVGTDIQLSLPNRSAVRAQGKLLVSRTEKGASITKPIVRWRYIETMFQFSRNR